MKEKWQWCWPDDLRNRASFERTREWRATYGQFRNEDADCLILWVARGMQHMICVPMEIAG